MKLAERVDTWIGKTLFVPLIVRVCQRTKVSQHTLSRVCWFATFLISFFFATSLFDKWLFGIFALLASLNAGLSHADSVEISWRWFRLLIIALTLLTVPFFIGTGEFRHLVQNALILIAEYAATIRTIPPLESKKEARKTLAASEA